jgi:hypothetical protein
MFANIFQKSNPEALLIKKYRKCRNNAKELSQTILEKYTDGQSLRVVSQLMGIRHGKYLMLDSEDEMDFLMDFSLFEYKLDGKSFLDRYKEENLELDEYESEIIDAKLLAYTSLFKIIESDPSSATVLLRDLFNELQEVKFLDVNLSQTSIPGALMFTRIVPLQDFNMTSGMFCIFPANSEKYILKQYKSKVKKVKSDTESVRRFITFFKLNRIEGLEVRTSSF